MFKFIMDDDARLDLKIEIMELHIPHVQEFVARISR